jgi:hypothetical protein
MTEDESRKQFEAWVSSLPFEYEVCLSTDFAWQAWQSARTSEPVQYAAFWKSSGKMIHGRIFEGLGDAIAYRKLQFERHKIEIREIRISVGEVVK